LEFKQVFVVGMEEDLFPSQMMMQSREDLEEERRLFYVASTRAMDKLYLTYALTRYRFGRLLNCEPSRFLEEVDPMCIRVNKRMTSALAGALRNESSEGKSGFVGIKNQNQRPMTTAKIHTPSPDFKPSNTNNLQAGAKVEHPKFGFGLVNKIETEGINRKASIQFDNFGEKTLLLSFAKLRIIE
jgi:DNA helicase-2/ATP-dependent DNA helicase PcrA